MLFNSQQVWQAWREAQELTWREYVDARTQAHNKWLSESDLAWRRYGEKTPYPVLPEYPSDAQIQQRADQILQWVQQRTQAPAVTLEPTVHEPHVTQTSAPEPSPESAPEPPQAAPEPTVSAPLDPEQVAPPQPVASDHKLLDHHAGHMIFGLNADRLVSLAQLSAQKMDQEHVDRHAQTVHQLERMIHDIRSTAA